MPDLTTDFQSLPEEYQQVIRLAQDTHKITVALLQLLVGGWVRRSTSWWMCCQWSKKFEACLS